MRNKPFSEQEKFDFRLEKFNLKKLYYFARIVEIGSLTRASADLCIAQPALTKTVQTLEADFGIRLLERSPKGIRATPAGERLYGHCQTVFYQLQRTYADVRAVDSNVQTAVRIGMPYSLNVILAAPLLQRALDYFPTINLEIIEDHSAELTSRLTAGHIDLGVIVSEGNFSAALGSEKLLSEEFYLVSAADRTAERTTESPAATRRLTLEYAASESLLLASGQLRKMIEDRFARKSLSLTAVRETDTFSMIPQCVEAGIGKTILPAGWFHAVMAKQLAYSAFDDPIMKRDISVCHRAEVTPTPAMEQVKILLKDTVASLIESQRWQGAHLAVSRVGGPLTGDLSPAIQPEEPVR